MWQKMKSLNKKASFGYKKCHSDDRREEESRMHKVCVFEILRFALNDKSGYLFN